MSRRVLIVEPDAPGRAMMDRVLTSGGLGAETAASAIDAQALLDAAEVEVVVIDELAGSHGSLEEVRWLRARYPTVPVVVTGALLSRRVMQDLLRLHVADALAKPFTPDELREAVARASAQRTARHEEALEYDASLTDARRAIAAGLLEKARAPLARAHATSPFDSEIMTLFALLAELDGRDSDADRGFRAALALRDEEASAAPDPHEGLARLSAYAGARPTRALANALIRERVDPPIWIVSDPATELRASFAIDGIDARAPHLVVASLGVTTEDRGAVFFREGDGARSFALLACSLRVESVAAALSAEPSMGAGPIFASELTRARFDIPRLEALRNAGKAAT